MRPAGLGNTCGGLPGPVPEFVEAIGAAGGRLPAPPWGKPAPAVGDSHSAWRPPHPACKRPLRPLTGRRRAQRASSPLADLTRAPSCSLEPAKVACMTAICCWTGWREQEVSAQPPGRGWELDEGPCWADLL